MTFTSATAVEVISALVSVCAIAVGWFLRVWAESKEATLRDDVLRVRDDQVGSLRQEVELLRSLRPFHVQQYLLTIAQRLAEDLNKIERSAADLETSRSKLENRANDLSGEIEVQLANVADLEHRKRGIRDFEHGLQKLIDRSQTEHHTYLESGNEALRAATDELAAVACEIAEHNATIANTRAAITEVEREIAALNVEVAARREKALMLRTRKEQMYAAADSILQGQAALTSSETPAQVAELAHSRA